MAQALSAPSHRTSELVLTGELLVLLLSLPLFMLLVVISRPLFIIAAVVGMVYGAAKNALRRAP